MMNRWIRLPKRNKTKTKKQKNQNELTSKVVTHNRGGGERMCFRRSKPHAWMVYSPSFLSATNVCVRMCCIWAREKELQLPKTVSRCRARKRTSDAFWGSRASHWGCRSPSLYGKDAFSVDVKRVAVPSVRRKQRRHEFMAWVSLLDSWTCIRQPRGYRGDSKNRKGASGSVVWWGTMLQVWRSRGRDTMTQFPFIFPILPAALGPGVARSQTQATGFTSVSV
jgi:hypothetical protein